MAPHLFLGDNKVVSVIHKNVVMNVVVVSLKYQYGHFCVDGLVFTLRDSFLFQIVLIWKIIKLTVWFICSENEMAKSVNA